LSLTRPDGLLFAAVLVIDASMKSDRRYRLGGISYFIFIVLAWIIFGFIYFGSPLPNSAVVKFVADARDPIPLGQKLKNLAGFRFTGLMFFAVPLLITGILYSCLRHRALALPLIWLGIYIAALIYSKSYIFPWYYTPVIAFFVLYAVIGGSVLTGSLHRLFKNSSPLKLCFYTACIVLCVFIVRGTARGIRLSGRSLAAYYHRFSKPHLEVAQWLKENTPPSSVICAGDIGHIGFYSGRTILDYNGLVSPKAIRYRMAGDYLGLFAAYKPDYAAGGDYGLTKDIVRNAAFRKDYTLVKTIRTKNAIKWFIFKRKTTP
jgi:hypothetical protein